ncbi:MAG: hypothetical protein OXG04_09670 [Acidobacteria bacterium]|nr:hypothetical protein [Acidobacteriota bacterium]
MRYSSRRPLPRDSADHSRAECFAKLVLTGREDHHGRNLLGYAERTADRLAMHREKTLAWLSISLHADSVDETTLTGVGFNDQDVRHATVIQPREQETAMAYAERLAAYNEPEAFAVGEAMLDESADTNPTVPTGTTDTAREQAIGRLRSAHKDWAQGRRGDRPPAGGIVDERPTAPGLADAVRRLEHHVRMTELCLSEMQRGPGGTPWGIAERLSLDDLNTFLDAASQLMFNAAAIVIETSNLTPTPAAVKERATLAGTREPGTEHLAGIATTAATIYEVATRLQSEIPPPTADDRIH